MRAFKLIQGRFLSSFFLSADSGIGLAIDVPLFYGSFVQHFHNLLIYEQFLCFGRCHLFWNSPLHRNFQKWYHVPLPTDKIS